MHSQKWNVRKVSIDTLYSLCVICPKDLQDFKIELIEAVNILKTDKNKYVREAAMAALNALKELPGEEPKKETAKPVRKNSPSPGRKPNNRNQEIYISGGGDSNYNNPNDGKNPFINEMTFNQPKDSKTSTKSRAETRAEIANNKLKMKGEAKRNNLQLDDKSQKRKRNFGINRKNINPAFLKKSDEDNLINVMVDNNDKDIEIFVNENQAVPLNFESNNNDEVANGPPELTKHNILSEINKNKDINKRLEDVTIGDDSVKVNTMS